MKVRSYPLLVRCIEEGVRMGWSRAHKHTTKPDEDLMCSTMEREVLNAICEYFSFEDEHDA